MDRGVGDRKSHLGNHTALLRALNRAAEVTVVIKTAERTGDVGALLFLDLEHQIPDISRDRIHPKGVQSPLKHVGLDPGFMERRRPLTDSHIGILSEKEIDLLKSASVGLNPVEATHIHDSRGYLTKLVDPGDVLARALPHVPVHQGELDFSCHMLMLFLYYNLTNILIFRYLSLTLNAT